MRLWPIAVILCLFILWACATAPKATRDPAANPDLPWQYVTVDTPAVSTEALRAELPTATANQVQMVKNELPTQSHYWQIQVPADQIESVERTDKDFRRATDASCPAGMVGVSGRMKRDDPKRGTVEDLQRQDGVCLKWLDPADAYPRRCAVFNPQAWQAIATTLPTKDIPFFCIDRFEYPNQKGAMPAIDVTWVEAMALCHKEGKRLCSEDEWTFACEGEDAQPYSYGYVRSDESCNIDKAHIDVRENDLSPRDSDKARAELNRLWKGEPIGSRRGCVSQFGVFDMTGNVDEWTVTSSRPFKDTRYVPEMKNGQPVLGPDGKPKMKKIEIVPSIFKGGYWSVVRTQCRPSTRAHGEWHSFYQEGFRCCKTP
jgi:formylglycine-generating enzyme required for sulfatase activity